MNGVNHLANCRVLFSKARWNRESFQRVHEESIKPRQVSETQRTAGKTIQERHGCPELQKVDLPGRVSIQTVGLSCSLPSLL